jgi:hypothetical protein
LELVGTGSITISRGKIPATLAKLRYAELIPAPHAALRTALVTAMAFAHHKAQEKTEKKIAAP